MAKVELGENCSLGWASSSRDGWPRRSSAILQWSRDSREWITRSGPAVVPSVRGQPGASVSVHSGVQRLESRLCLPKAVRHWSLRSVQVKLIWEAVRLIFQLSEVSFLDGCSRECFVSAGRRRQAEGGYNHDFAKRESAPVGLSSMHFHPIGGGPKTTKWTRNSRQETHPLLDRPEIAGLAT